MPWAAPCARALYAVPGTGLRHELNLAGLAPGLYALRVTTVAQTATRRLLVE